MKKNRNSANKNEKFFHAYYREPGPLPRRYCDHPIFFSNENDRQGKGRQVARIDTYLFGLTARGKNMFRSFLDEPEMLAQRYGWNIEIIAGLIKGEGWAGKRIPYKYALIQMRSYADTVLDYKDGSVLYVFSRKKVDFNVEIYSTDALNFIEGFIIASIESYNYKQFISITINENNMLEIEGDYGLNPPPDDNPWLILYDGYKLSFRKNEIWPK